MEITLLNPREPEPCDECECEGRFALCAIGEVADMALCVDCLRKWRDTITEALNANP